jgi:hypothetical protein
MKQSLSGLFGTQVTGKMCPNCGVALTGKVSGWTNKGEIGASDLPRGGRFARDSSNPTVTQPGDEAPGYAVVVTSLPKPEKKPGSWANLLVANEIQDHQKRHTGVERRKGAINEDLKKLPWATPASFTKAQAISLRDALREREARAEIVGPSEVAEIVVGEGATPIIVSASDKPMTASLDSVADGPENEVAEYSVVITSLPKPNRKPEAFGNLGVESCVQKHLKRHNGLKRNSQAIYEDLENLPWTVPLSLSQSDATGFRNALINEGALSEIVALARAEAPRRIEASPTSSSPDTGAAATGGSDPTVPGQIRELGGLRDAGLITEQEFETKKAELLNRL